jgi:2,5-furandicarboxylate decarboxylase 1
MPAAFWIGHHPLVVMGAQTHVGPDESHYESAGGTLGTPLRLVPSETLGDDFLVPADAEVVIEGFVPCGQRKPEGPFGEYHRHFGPQQWAPKLKVTAVTRRRKAYWSDLMVGHTHWVGGLPDEGEIYHAVRRTVPAVRAVHLPMSGSGRMVAYVQIRKTLEGQGRAAATAALVAKSVVKYVFVVDEDIDVYDEREVMMAFATRFRAQHGLIRLDGMPDPPADPASSNGMITKLGFDCTKPLGEDFPERLSVPDDVLRRIDPVEILGRERFERVPIELWG